MFPQDQRATEPDPSTHKISEELRPHRDPALPIDESDSEDDEVLRNTRNTAELLRHDNGVFEDGGREGLGYVEGDAGSGGWKFGRLGYLLGRMGGRNARLSGSQWRGRYADMNPDARQRRRHRGRHRRLSREEEEEEEELVFELEEGDEDDGSHASSLDYSEKAGDYLRYSKRSNSKSRFWVFATISVFVVILFLVLLFGSYRATLSNRKTNELLLNNSSSLIPTTILISLDGFRADFLTRGITPTLQSFIDSGISPKYMIPSFPSVTFPNHFTLVTGLYPESHGIVGNTFWDPNLKEEFFYTDPSRSMQPKWWTAEPIWVTAENQGIRSAVHMWPGSEAHIGGMDPFYLDNFNADERLNTKVDRILELIDIPGPSDTRAKPDLPRPQLIAAYVPIVDAKGHKFGPNSTEINEAIKGVDDMVAGILNGLEERELADVVNVVVVSDHGMASTDATRLYQLEDLIDTSIIEHIDGWPLYGLRLADRDPAHLDRVYKKLRRDLQEDPNIEVRLRSTMPEKYHFSDNDRIAPLWLVPKAGWAIVKKDEFDVQEALGNGEAYHPMGLHGYDHEHPLMRAIFVARGPAFPHAPGSRMEVFQNTEVYNLVCESVGIKALPNNGTLHLPLKPVGLHSDFEGDSPNAESPTGSYSTPLSATGKAAVIASYQTSNTVDSVAQSTPGSTEIPNAHATDAVDEPSGNMNDKGNKNKDNEDFDNDERGKKAHSWLSWFKEKFKNVKDWVKSKVHHDQSDDDG